MLLIGAIFAYIPGIEADTPNTVAYSSVFVSAVSLIIGNIGCYMARARFIFCFLCIILSFLSEPFK